jgi:hypothetical protein
MAEMVRQIRGVYARSLIVLLFPFVLLATMIEEIPADWRQGFALGFVTVPVLTLALLAVIGIVRMI